MSSGAMSPRIEQCPSAVFPFKRRLRLPNATLNQGPSGSISINLLGRAMKWLASVSLRSLAIHLLQRPPWKRATGSSLNLNTSEVSSGRLAAVWVPSHYLSVHNSEVLKLNLTPSGSGFKYLHVSLIDSPVLRETSTRRNELPTTY